MIAMLSIIYASFYFLFFKKLKLFAESVRNISVFVGIGIVMIGTIVFAWWTFAPTSVDGRVFSYVIPIVPNVKGQVIEVPAEPLVSMKKGDVLYKIDPTPYQYAVDSLAASIDQARAQRRLAEIEVERTTGLVRASAGAQAELDRWKAELAGAQASIVGLQAQLGNAQWQLDETVVRAPHDGYVVNLQLRPGNYVTTMPVAAALAFVSDETHEVIASFSQSAIRRTNIGDAVDMVFSVKPGVVFTGKISHIVRASGDAQLSASGQIPTVASSAGPSRWVVRVAFDDPEAAAELPQSAAASNLAVYTQYGKAVQIISKVVIRMSAWTGYLTSP
jgi:RND family efflux transporter MFP subunit